MYAALWRLLPGPWWLRTLIVVFFLTLLLIACVMFIFPWVDQTWFAPADPLIDTGVIDGGTVGDGSGEGVTVDDAPAGEDGPGEDDGGLAG